jgi:hypothetical protein
MRVRRTAPLAAEKPGAWASLDDLGDLALPAPVRRLLASIEEDGVPARQAAG